MSMLKLNGKEKRFLIIWSTLLIGLFVCFTILGTKKVYDDKVVSHQNHKDRVNPNKKERSRTWISPKKLKRLVDKDHPAEKVTVGMYLDHIVELSTKNTDWTVDFYIWFRWKDKELDPGKNFHVINGEILSRELIDSADFDNERYELHHVSAKITKFFNITRYPRDDHMLTIEIENKYYPWSRMQYVPDVQASSVSSRGKLPGYALGNSIVLATKAHRYKTNRGYPHMKHGKGAVYDRLIFAVEISRPDWGLYYKMFLFLFASVAVSLLVFIMKPTSSERVGLGVGAFFSAVASSYVTTSELPGVGILTLCDLINILGMVTIFLTVLSSVIVKHIAVDKEDYDFAKLVNRLTFWIFLVGYIASNVIIAQTASA